ncbi:hypothetical protein ACWGOE_08265 [Leucobacter chromiiresistens]
MSRFGDGSREPDVVVWEPGSGRAAADAAPGGANASGGDTKGSGSAYDAKPASRAAA